MSSKIICVWGDSGSGKTTFAASLACTLASRDCLVGLISSNLTYGNLQIFYGQSVPLEKGLFRALNDDNPNVGEKFTEVEESKNVFLLSVPNHYTGLLCDSISLQNVERLMTDASLLFDILIVDGAGNINNPISDAALWLAGKIYTLYKPSIAAQMWHKGMEDFIKELRIAEKQVNILREPNGEFDGKAFKGMIELSFSYELPFVKCAPELENAGTPIYLSNDRPCRLYARVLKQIAKEVCGGMEK
ncbi:cobalamin biosynthesis protein CobQ [Dehalobacterium formicoaceticum]|uniref:cobalamin biosynthesis protein CobQ n=1 Tax=Dehalobacterium formicoaceticum TaxID=51515 RepID=UPI0031F6DE06